MNFKTQNNKRINNQNFQICMEMNFFPSSRLRVELVIITRRNILITDKVIENVRTTTESTFSHVK